MNGELPAEGWVNTDCFYKLILRAFIYLFSQPLAGPANFLSGNTFFLKCLIFLPFPPGSSIFGQLMQV